MAGGVWDGCATAAAAARVRPSRGLGVRRDCGAHLRTIAGGRCGAGVGAIVGQMRPAGAQRRGRAASAHRVSARGSVCALAARPLPCSLALLVSLCRMKFASSVFRPSAGCGLSRMDPRTSVVKAGVLCSFDNHNCTGTAPQVTPQGRHNLLHCRPADWLVFYLSFKTAMAANSRGNQAAANLRPTLCLQSDRSSANHLAEDRRDFQYRCCSVNIVVGLDENIIATVSDFD